MHAPSMIMLVDVPAWKRRLAALTATVALAAAVALAVSLTVLAAPAGAAGVSRYAEQPSVSALPPAEVEQVLSDIPLKDFSATQLSEVLSRLPGLSGLPAASVQTALTSAIEKLTAEGDTLGQLAGSHELLSKLEAQLNELPVWELLALLEGKGLSSVLNEALKSLNARQTVGGLLGSSANPEQLLGQVLTASNLQALETLLGTTLTGAPFSKGTVEELASDAGTTPEGLANDLGTSVSQLASPMALTVPLTNGKTLGVLDAVEGVDVGLLGLTPGTSPEGSAGGGGGSGGGAGGSSGGVGGSGGSGGSSGGTPGATTVILNMPSAAAVGRSNAAGIASAKVKILSRKIRGGVVTLVVQVPGAGALALTGKDVKTLRRQSDRAERMTLRAVLTKTGLAARRKHRHHSTVKLEMSFRRAGGANTTMTVVFVRE